SSTDGKFVLKILGTLGTVSTLPWYEFKAEEGGILESESHGSGSLENLTLVSGKLLVISGTESRELISGETLRFLTDSPHRLESLGPEPAHGFMVNLLNSNEFF
ncbi:MAG: XRE family transcriptional regulator, partial [SAR324 cluster bacterium]|nr:XRE family transcriptional regulator [SAR324 cluster bacterium]